MTVGELRALLASYPEDMRIVAYGCDQGGLEDMVLKPITCVFDDAKPRGGYFDLTRHSFGDTSNGIAALLCDYTTTEDDASYVTLLDASGPKEPGAPFPLPRYPKILFHRHTLAMVTVCDMAQEDAHLASGDYVQSPAEVGVETHPMRPVEPAPLEFTPSPWESFVGLTIAAIDADEPDGQWYQDHDDPHRQLTLSFTNGSQLILEPSGWCDSEGGPLYIVQGEPQAVREERDRVRKEYQDRIRAFEQRKWHAWDKQYIEETVDGVITLNTAAAAEPMSLDTLRAVQQAAPARLSQFEDAADREALHRRVNAAANSVDQPDDGEWYG